MFDALKSALSTVGDVLDKPRQMVYGGIVNPLFHALGGDPNKRIEHAADLLTSAGMDPDSWLTKGLGFAGDIATDPLTYAGGWAAKAARKALLPGEIAGGAGRIAPGAVRNLGAGSTFRKALADVPVFENARFVPAEQAVAEAPHMLEAPGIYKMEGTVVKTPEGRVALGAVNSNDQAFRGSILRGGNLGETMNVPDKIAAKATSLSRDGPARITAAAEHLPGETAAADAMYDPFSRSTILNTESSIPKNELLRHENTHTIIGTAAETGDFDGLPAIMRIPAQLLRSKNPFLHTLGDVGNELASQSLQKRNTLKQLQSGANFLFNPELNQQYSKILAGNAAKETFDPRALAIYSALPKTVPVAGAMAGGGAGVLGRALGD